MSGSSLVLDELGHGGSSLRVGGNLTDSSSPCIPSCGIQIGSVDILSTSMVTVAGKFNNTGSVSLFGSSGSSLALGGEALLEVGGEAPSTLTGAFFVAGDTGGAAVEYGSGRITQIGDNANDPWEVYLNGPKAFMELSSAPESNSALTSLRIVANNGTFEIGGGTSLDTSGSLENWGTIFLDPSVLRRTLTLGGLTSGPYMSTVDSALAAAC
jgi:hypothetical protein